MKKIHLSVIGLFTVSLLCAAMFASGTAQATSSTCFDVTGQGKPVTMDGVANSGTVYFDEPNAPALAYEACMDDPGFDNVGPFYMKGWSWDDNLGWVSFYCGDEDGNAATPRTNLGVLCGNYDYGVSMDGPGTSTPGMLHGFAFGDATGYISFNCLDSSSCATIDYSVAVETIDLCAGTVYGTISPSPSTCSPHADDVSYIYGWSDNVGWLNFDGVTFPWVELTTAAVLIDLNVTPDPTDPDAAPYANGSDAYTMTLTMTDPDGDPIDPAEYSITATLDWDNKIGTNQTDGLDGSDAVTPPTEFPVGSYNPVNGTIQVSLASIAPSSLMNKTGDTFMNETFILPKTGADVQPNELNMNYLKFNNLLLSVIYDPGVPPAHDNVCLFGELYTCAPAPFPSDYQGANFNFKPPVQLTTFDDEVNETYLSLRNMVSSNISAVMENFCGTACVNPTAAINLGLTDETQWAMVRDGTEPEGFGVEDLSYDDFAMGPGALDFGVGTVCRNPETGCDAFGKDAFAYSTISYSIGGKEVKYFGNKLPRVQGTLVVNPVAKVVGSVYSTGVTNPQTGSVVKSLGDVSTNILRDTIFKNVSGIIAGKDKPLGVATISGYSSGFTVTGNYEGLMPDAGGVDRVYYFGDDLTINAGAADISWSGERTLIVIGGDVYIRSNLYNAPGSAKPRLGIIVLKDLATGAGGNIYVAENVTDIHANMFADGSLFSYDSTLATPINASGLPYFANENSRFNGLKNQLYIQGSIASQNTIGGAVAGTPILGDGSTTSGAEGAYGVAPSGRSLARLYDLNFLRYFGWVFDRNLITGDALDTDGDGAIEATPPSEGGDLILIKDGIWSKAYDATTILQNASAVLITFDPPPASLPGFGVTTGAEVQFRPQ